MFPLFGLSSRHTPRLRGSKVLLRAPERGDFREWAALRKSSRSFLEPWEPVWAADELELSAWRQRLRRYRQEAAAGSGFSFLVLTRGDERIAGGISIGNIRRGVAQSGQIGYWMGESYAGRGYMQEAVALVVEFAFRKLRLHRVEAACIPGNARSTRVLEKAGFQREGLLRSYLRINGVWQDHLLYALIADEHQPTRRRDGTV